MSYNLSAVPKLQFFDNDGNPLVGGKLYTYEAGTTTPLATYTDSTGATPNTNPIILDSRGEANVWLTAQSYKFILKTSTDTTIWTVDNVSNAINVSQILASSGTASAPPYSFSADTDTGVYLAAVGQMGLSANGVPFLRGTSTSMTFGQSGGASNVNVTHYGNTTQTGDLSLSGTASVGAGTVGAPSLTTAGDTDTGFWFPAANTLAASTGSTERLRINSSGNVGIGNTAPTSKLDVTGEIRASGTGGTLTQIDTTDDIRVTIYSDSSNEGVIECAQNSVTSTKKPLYLQKYGGNVYVGSGDVGIGTTSPASKLSVFKTSSVQIQASTASIDFRVQCIDANGAAYVGAVSNHALLFTTNNIARLKIDTDGSQSSVNPGTSTLYPQYACRAWVNFDGSGGATIRAAGNVSSVTYGGTGIYTVNFSTAMPDANYSPQASVSNRTTAQNAITQFNTPSTSSIGMDNYEAGVRRDNSYIYVAVFR